MADRVVLVRHGETEWSAARRHTGRTDIALTEHGRSQSAHISAALARLHIDTAISSPLSRALDTATLAGLDPSIDEDLVEWDYGEYEGRTTADVRRSIADWSVWTHPILGGESVDQVGARTDRAIAHVEPLDGTVALVAHAHLLRILAARWLALPPSDGQRFVLDTASISILGYERETRAVLRWNDPCGPPGT